MLVVIVAIGLSVPVFAPLERDTAAYGLALGVFMITAGEVIFLTRMPRSIMNIDW